MEKIKIDMSPYKDMHEEKEIEGQDGVKLTVRTHIPSVDKLSLAKEALAMTMQIHEDSVCYDSYAECLIWLYCLAKYYTNLDMEDVSIEDVADFFVNNGLEEAMRDAIRKDERITNDIYLNLRSSVETVFDDERSIRRAIRTSFPFLFTGEDITEALAQAEATGDTLFRAVGALRREEQQEKKKVDDGTVEVGGVVLNLRPRE